MAKLRGSNFTLRRRNQHMKAQQQGGETTTTMRKSNNKQAITCFQNNHYDKVVTLNFPAATA